MAFRLMLTALSMHEALAKILKGQRRYAPGFSSNVGSCEYSLPDSVVYAPPLIEMLPAEARFVLEDFLSRMLLPALVAAVIQEVRGNLDATTIRGCCAVRGRMPAFRPACVLGVFFVKKENRLRLIVDCLFPPPSVSCYLETGCRVSKSTLLVLPTESLLDCTSGALTLSTAFTGCVSLERFAIFSVAEGYRT